MELKISHHPKRCLTLAPVPVSVVGNGAFSPCRKPKSIHRYLQQFPLWGNVVWSSAGTHLRSVRSSSASSMGPGPMSRRCTVGLLASPLLLGNPQMTRGVVSNNALDLLVDAHSNEGFSTLGAALAAAAPAATIKVAAGTYRERVSIIQAVTIEAYPKGAEVVIIWETDKSYEPVVYSFGAGAVLRGLTLRHASPSVANNYAVFLQNASTVLEDCDINSSTGSGVGLEGGSLTLRNCTVSRCRSHGVALFSSLEDEASACVILGCTIADNRLDGVLTGPGSTLTMTNSMVTSNGAWGLEVRGEVVKARDNIVMTNGQGAAATLSRECWRMAEGALSPLLNRVQGRMICKG